MGVKLIRKAVCDICGKECSFVQEKIFHEDVCEQYLIKQKHLENNVYHYTEITSKTFDSRFGESEESKVVFCGDCFSELNDYLKNKKGGAE